MDKSVSKFTTKFVIKFLLWFILFTVIGTIGVTVVFANSIENIGDDAEELAGALNGLIIGLVVVDFIVAFITTKLSIKGVTKKVEVTAENKRKIIQNVALVLGIFAILTCSLHMAIKNGILDMAGEESGVDIEELKEDLEEYVEKYDLSESEEEEVEAFLEFMKMTNLYVFDSLFLLVMIPIAKRDIDKKIPEKV